MERAGVTDGVVIAISAGELIDRITILQIKSERIQDPQKLANVRTELAELREVRTRELESHDELTEMEARLRHINELLWDIEDSIRRCERLQDFGSRFIRLARSVYLRNDQRAAVKRAINDRVGSRLVEEKDYDDYLPIERVAQPAAASAAD